MEKKLKKIFNFRLKKSLFFKIAKSQILDFFFWNCPLQPVTPLSLYAYVLSCPTRTTNLEWYLPWRLLRRDRRRRRYQSFLASLPYAIFKEGSLEKWWWVRLWAAWQRHSGSKCLEPAQNNLHMMQATSFSVFYLVQLIEHTILQIPHFNFPNLCCCKVFFFSF